MAANDINATNFFSQLSKVSVKDKIEKKGQISYLSWAWAIEVLKTHDPEASWTFLTFDGKPYQQLPDGTCMVWCVLRAFGREFVPQWLPIMDNRNKAIANPDAFAINTSLMRCLVKAIAVHTGLGLSLYYGEDVPREDASDWNAEIEATINAIKAAKDYTEARRLYDEGVQKARDHSDPGAANAFKSTMLARPDVPARSTKREAA